MPVNDALASEQWTRFQYCVSGAAEVLTSAGFKRLDCITIDDLIYDGERFVAHEGLLRRGAKRTVTLDGVRMTPEHKVLVGRIWIEAKNLNPDDGVEEEVYDLLNCGPDYRFAVKSANGLMVVANCRDRGHLEFINKADKCDRFFAGDQWNQADLNVLTLARRPALTINKIISTLGTLFGEQIYQRNETIFRPASGAQPQTAEALTKCWKEFSQANQLPWVRSELFADGTIRSRGFLDMRLDFTDSMQGEAVVTNLNSKNVVIDPDAEEYDPDNWMDVFTTKWVTPQDVAIGYSEEDADLLKIKDGSSFPYGYDSIERVRDRFGGVLPLAGYYGVHEPSDVRRNIRLLDRQYRKLDKQLHFVDIETGDMRPVPQSWDRNRIALVIDKAQGKVSTMKKLVKRIRWCVTADNIVLHDEWSPYKHFTVIPYFPYFRYGRTIGLVENLLGPQEMLNKVSSQEMHVVNTTANSGWKVKKGSLTNMTTEELEQKGASTGLVLELTDTKDAEKITPNATPQGLDRLSYKAEEHIKTISNVNDSMQGMDREDVAAKAIAQKKQSGSTNHTKVMDNLNRTDFLLARNWLDLTQEYMTEPRLVHITHDNVTQETEEISVNTRDPESEEILNDLTIGEYSIIITSQPFRDTLEDSQFEQTMAMREAGIQIDDETIIENSRLMRKNEIVKKMEAAKNSPEAQQRAQLDMRMLEAQVATAEAESQVKTADAQLKQAKTKKELASIELDAQRLQLDAQAAQGGEGEMEKAQMEMEVEGQKAEAKMGLEERQFQHKESLSEREFALKERQHEADEARAADMHAHQKEISSKQADAQAEATKSAALQSAFSPEGDSK